MGISSSFSGGVLTISGNPTISFNYTVTTTGTCAQTTATGSVTVTPNAAIALTSPVGTNAQTLCSNIAIAPITYSVTGGGTGAGVTGLPTGVTGSYSGGVFTITGTPSVTGTFNYTVTTTGTCNQVTAIGTITINPGAVITLTSAVGTNAQSLCVNTAIIPITYSITSGGTGASVTGLPTGISGSYSGGVFTISGTSATTGTYNYTVTTTGPCPPVTATGSIIVSPNAAIVLTSAVGTDAQTLCINMPISAITYSVTGGGTGAGVTGLPAGITGSYSGGVFTISGTPTVSGTFNYIVTTTGACAQVTATGSIVVTPDAAIVLTSAVGSDSQTLCNNTAMASITYSITGGGTGAGVTGLPSGVTGSFFGGVFTISGTPTGTGTFNYTVTTTGTCAQVTATGSIIISSDAVITLTSAIGTNAQTLCINTALGAITYSVTGGGTGASVTGLPAGVTGSYSGGVFTISGTPTATGTFNYTVTTTGTCAQTTATGSIIVTPNAAIVLTSAVGTNAQTLCVNTGLTSISYSVTGGGTGAGVTGLPAGITGSYSGGVFTISGTPTVSGTFNYTVTTTGTCAQTTATGTIIVNPIPATPIAGNNSPICAGSQLDLTSNAVTGATYNWTGPNGFTASIEDPTVSANATIAMSGTYSVTVTVAGCTSLAGTTSVSVNPSPIASFTTSPNPATGASPLVVSFTNTSQNATTYSWNFGDNTSSVSANPPSNTYTTGVYTVVLTATNNLCTSTASVTVIVYDNYSIFIPNVFTPNGDNNNEIFKITATGVSTFDAIIFDRWGLKMSEWHDVSGGWNGRTKGGAEARDGTYYYIITLKAADGTDHEYKGYLMLLK